LCHLAQAPRAIPQELDFLAERHVLAQSIDKVKHTVVRPLSERAMEHDPDHLRRQAERARWWATWTPDPIDRERLETVARDYEEMARIADREAASQSDY
jgi:hypothetical protein